MTIVPFKASMSNLKTPENRSTKTLLGHYYIYERAFRLGKKPRVKTIHEAAAVLGQCYFRHQLDNEIQSSKSSMSDRSIHLKAYQMPKPNNIEEIWRPLQSCTRNVPHGPHSCTLCNIYEHFGSDPIP